MKNMIGVTCYIQILTSVIGNKLRWPVYHAAAAETGEAENK